MCLQKEKGCFLNNLYKNGESLVTLQLPSNCCLVFWTSETEKRDTITICKNLPKTKDVPFRECHVTRTEKGKNLLIYKCHVRMTKNRCVYKKRYAAPKSLFNFQSQKTYHFFQLPTFYLVRPWLIDTCFLGQAKLLYPLCGLRQMSRQIWTIFLVQKRLQLLGCKTQSIQERWRQRFPTGSKCYNERVRFPLVYAIEESAG